MAALLLTSLAPTFLAAQPTSATVAGTTTPAARRSVFQSELPRPTLNFGVDEQAEITTGPIRLTSGTYAVFHTGEGDILVRLFPDKTPKTVENFIGLATGAKTWKHPVTMADMKTPVFNNTTIYKTVENAVLYGGDPINRGVGDPGFTIPLEFAPDLKFDQPGTLAMNLSGPNASGSRWILALRSFPDYSGRYPVFGRVIAGMDVARAISRKPERRPTVPLDPVLVNSIEIVQIPAGKATTATYATEDGKRFVTLEKNFVSEDAAPLAASKPQDSVTTAADGTTTATDAVTTASEAQNGETTKTAGGSAKTATSPKP